MGQDFFVVSLCLNVLSAVVILIRTRAMKLNPGNYYLVGFLLLFTSLSFSGYTMYFLRDPDLFSWLYGIVSPLLFLLGPFTYFYVRSCLTGDSRLRLADLVHFVPALVHTLNLLPYLLTPHEFKVEQASLLIADFNQLNTLDVFWFLPAWYNTLVRSLLSVLYPAYLLIAIARGTLPGADRPDGERYRPWLLTFTGTQILVFLPYFTVLAFNFFFGVSMGQSMELMPELSPIILFIYMAMIALSIIPHLFPAAFMVPDASSMAELPVNGATISEAEEPLSLSPEEVAEITEKIHHAMVTQKPQCNTTFSLQDLAKLVGVPSYKIRTCLREAENMSWPEFRLTWRMREAANLLQSGTHQNLTIEALAGMCGYENRGTFYQHFRGHFGMTPGEFIENVTTGEPTS